MKLAHRNTLLSLLFLLTLAPAAWPAGWSEILKDDALLDFTDDDVRGYLDALNALLDAPLPAAPVEWSNPQTGAGARLEVIGQPDIEGFDECRRVRTSLYSRKHKVEPRTWTACRGNDGAWRLARGS